MIGLFFWIFAHFSMTNIYAPELVVDHDAVKFAAEFNDYGYEVIVSAGQPDWYSFIFIGTKVKGYSSGSIFTVNNHGHTQPTDMTEKPIFYWHDDLQNGKSIGKIFFRDKWRKLCFSPSEKILPCK